MDAKKTIEERVAEGAEKMIETGTFPSWMEPLTYDTAKVMLGKGDGEWLVVCSPPKSAATRFRNVSSQLSRLAAKAKDGTDVADDLDKFSALVNAAEAEYLSVSILEVGTGLRFRSDVVHNDKVEFKAGDPIPAPRTVRDEALRVKVVMDGFPEVVCRRVYDATGFLAAQGLGALLGNE